jgi:hypothetical protein
VIPSTEFCDHEVTTMGALKEVGVREFRDHATKYLSGSETVAVSKHGRIIGFYLPLERNEDEVHGAIDDLSKAVSQVLQETGMNEEELIELLGLKK